MNPAALVVADAARLLSAGAGEAITVEMIEADLADGAPRNGDGTVHLVHYGAWLLTAGRKAESGDRNAAGTAPAP